MRRIIALDPGGTTGWATWSDHDREGVSKFICGQMGPGDHHKMLYDFLGDQQTDAFTIVTERFEYRNTARPGLDLSSREYIGVVKLFVQERMPLPQFINEPSRLVMQNASQAKGFVQDRHIKKLGLWSSGNKHAMDAMRHLLFYMVHTTSEADIGRRLLEAGWK